MGGAEDVIVSGVAPERTAEMTGLGESLTGVAWALFESVVVLSSVESFSTSKVLSYLDSDSPLSY